MVVACPPVGGSGARRCGCRPRSGSRRGLSRRKWHGGCGSRVIRRTCGGGAGGQGGQAALASGGPGGAVCRLSGAQLERLRAALEAGPAVWGWAEDQRWTLARVTTLTGRLFHVRYTLRGTSYLLHRLGYTPQMPVHRAAERDEAKIAAWRAGTRAKARGQGRGTGWEAR